MEKEFRRVKAWIHENRRKEELFLQKLVREGSIRGKEARAQAVIIEKCRQLGMEVDIWEIGESKVLQHPAFCSDRIDFKGNPNVVARLKGSGGGKSLILNGHIDVVPVNNRDDWKDDPFSGKIKDGKLFGRGSTDMKGGSVALLVAIEAIIATGITLKGDLVFQSVIEEESGGAGTLAAVLRGYRADGAIIPEPTNMKIFPKQQGSMWFRIQIKGRSAHGGTRYEGISAIEKSLPVLEVLKKLEVVRNARITDPLYEQIPIPIPINIGKINSGEWPSSVPDLCTIEGRIGVAPDERMEDVQKELVAALNQLEEEDNWYREHPPKIEWFGGRWLPGTIPEDHPLLDTITSSFKRIRKEAPVIEASPWGTDGGILSQVGNTPVIVFGPGVTAVAHDANEYINLDDVFEAAEVIADVILHWCGIKEYKE